MSENIILKYRREFDCWVCDECDIENPTTQNTCSVCNSSRSSYATILKAWTPEDEIIINSAPPHKIPQTSPPTPQPIKMGPMDPHRPIFSDNPVGRYDPPPPPPPPSSGNMSAILIWLIVFIVIFAVLILIGIYGS